MFVLVAANPGDAATGKGNWIVDPTSQCGTSNPFFVIGESIRWYGACRDGKLAGQGTLIWYQDQQEKERNSGKFANGEFNGEVITTFPDGQIIVGNYREGVRHGMFTIVRADARHYRVVYNRGKGETNRPMTDAEVAEWRETRLARANAKPPTPRRGVAEAVQQPIARPQVTQAAVVQARRAKVAQPEPAQSTIRPAARQAAVLPTRPRVAPARATKSAEEEESLLDTTLNALNPVTWYDAVVGLIDFGDDTAQVAAVAPVAPKVILPAVTRSVAAPTPVTRRSVARPAPRQQFRQQASAPALQTAVRSQPQARTVSSRAFASAESTGGKWYDMSHFLSEPHPFAGVKSGKSRDRAEPVFVPAARRIGQTSRVITQRADGHTANALLGQAIRLEQQGSPVKAEAVYEQVATLFATSPSAEMARARLSRIAPTNPNPQFSPVVNLPQPAQPPMRREELTPNDGRRVVALNSPLPPGYRGENTSSRANYLQIYDSDWIGKSVCSRSGLYQESAGWCGVVQRDDKTHLIVTVRDVTLNSFGMIGITRSRCSGGAFLNWFSRGSTVRVPKQCMSEKG